MFKTMKDSAGKLIHDHVNNDLLKGRHVGLITGMASMSFFAGAIWISILRTFTRVCIRYTPIIDGKAKSICY